MSHARYPISMVCTHRCPLTRPERLLALDSDHGRRLAHHAAVHDGLVSLADGSRVVENDHSGFELADRHSLVLLSNHDHALAEIASMFQCVATLSNASDCKSCTLASNGLLDALSLALDGSHNHRSELNDSIQKKHRVKEVIFVVGDGG